MLISNLAQWEPEDHEQVEEQTVGGLLRWAATEAPDQTALIEGVADPAARRRWTYRRVAGRVRAGGAGADRAVPAG